MKKSCNGCRVLRKACNVNCSIRPCLQWIQDSRCQANATQFLAKFYGRSNFINFIDAAPHDQRAAIFRSLLYEASGRIVNPIYGSVGLLSSGKWRTCQMAVEAVLKGEDITHSNIEAQTSMPPAMTVSDTDKSLPRSCAYDIRHIHTNKQIGSMEQKQKEFHGIINPSFGEVGFAGDNGKKIELDLTLGLDPISHVRNCTGNSPSGWTEWSENYGNFHPLDETSDGWTI